MRENIRREARLREGPLSLSLTHSLSLSLLKKRTHLADSLALPPYPPYEVGGEAVP